jgi:hypothetical protein
MPGKTSPTRSSHGQAICRVWEIHRPGFVQTANGVGSPRMFPAFAAVGSGYFAKDQFRSILQNVRRANKDNIGGCHVLGWSVRGTKRHTRGCLHCKCEKSAAQLLCTSYGQGLARVLGKTLTPVTLAAEDDSHGLGRSTYPQRNITSREAGVDRRTQP